MVLRQQGRNDDVEIVGEINKTDIGHDKIKITGRDETDLIANETTQGTMGGIIYDPNTDNGEEGGNIAVKHPNTANEHDDGFKVIADDGNP